LHHRSRTALRGDRPDDGARLGPVPCPVNPRPRRLGPLGKGFEIEIEVGERLVLDVARKGPQRFPVVDRADRHLPPLTEKACRVPQGAAELGILQRLASVAIERAGGLGVRAHVGAVIGRSDVVVGRFLCISAHEVDASTSARCIARTLEPRRLSRPLICIRQLASADTTAPTPASSMASTLSSTIATEISGYLTVEKPPKPPQASAFDSSTSSAPRTRESRRRGSLFTPSSRSA